MNIVSTEIRGYYRKLLQYLSKLQSYKIALKANEDGNFIKDFAGGFIDGALAIAVPFVGIPKLAMKYFGGGDSKEKAMYEEVGDLIDKIGYTVFDDKLLFYYKDTVDYLNKKLSNYFSKIEEGYKYILAQQNLSEPEITKIILSKVLSKTNFISFFSKNEDYKKQFSKMFNFILKNVEYFPLSPQMQNLLKGALYDLR